MERKNLKIVEDIVFLIESGLSPDHPAIQKLLAQTDLSLKEIHDFIHSKTLT